MMNLNYFNTLFPNQPEIIETVIDLTISEFPQFKRDVKRCVKKVDKVGLKKLAHKWQYTAKILGINEVWNNLDAFRECEKLGERRIKQLTTSVITQLEVVVDKLHELRVSA
ncbi:hypothetical protein BFP72_04565 [Reichenbachiella sp. 5M10]|uniref:hypothetical protein n=1 Tax=Reichenbachiella sp. 5M10 TaxID=1889772 RepID=UPI000C1447DD|nr:hypothetical protein [Reichenbachiella sp. 5M10]PIB34730.1 hypothetical protein BFP72_04565 [Reichenbachiella sp. 5M10]